MKVEMENFVLNCQMVKHFQVLVFSMVGISWLMPDPIKNSWFVIKKLCWKAMVNIVGDGLRMPYIVFIKDVSGEFYIHLYL